MKIYQMWFIYPDASFIRTILLGTKVSGLTRLDCICIVSMADSLHNVSSVN
jgi:hypothetical protein